MANVIKNQKKIKNATRFRDSGRETRYGRMIAEEFGRPTQLPKDGVGDSVKHAAIVTPNKHSGLL